MKKPNSPRFEWMRKCRWTIKEIKSTFQINSFIAEQIQMLFCDEEDARAIAKASRELCNGQIGF